MSAESGKTTDQDAEQLRALGYESHFDRTMSKWENFSLGFTYLSPVVGVYTLFAFAIAAGGPPMWWYLLVGLGQLMVCLVFGEIVSQFPISGGLYPWARRLVGKRWAWMAGWVYGWALCCTMAGVATGVAPFLAQLVGLRGHAARHHAIALALIGLTTALQPERHAPARPGRDVRLHMRAGRRDRRRRLSAAVRAPSTVRGAARHAFRAAAAAATWPAFLASSLAAMFCYYGFEACGDVAEETPNASRMIPKAMRMTIYIGGAAAMWVCLAFVLVDSGHRRRDLRQGHRPDRDAAARRHGRSRIPRRHRRGPRVVHLLLLSLQAAASRLLFAYARDEMIVGSKFLSPHLARPRTYPCALRSSIMGAIPALIALVGALAAECDRDHHQLRGGRHLHRVPDDRARGADRPRQGLAARRTVHARRVGAGS